MLASSNAKEKPRAYDIALLCVGRFNVTTIGAQVCDFSGNPFDSDACDELLSNATKDRIRKGEPPRRHANSASHYHCGQQTECCLIVVVSQPLD